MALNNIKFAKLRPKRHNLGVKTGLSPSSQSFRSNQTVTATGASRAIRPPLTAIRQMTDKGQGIVRYF